MCESGSSCSVAVNVNIEARALVTTAGRPARARPLPARRWRPARTRSPPRRVCVVPRAACVARARLRRTGRGPSGCVRKRRCRVFPCLRRRAANVACRVRRGRAVGLVGAARRNALAALSLHAGLESDVSDALPAVRELASQVGSSLMSIAMAVRERSGPPALPPLRQTQLALTTASDDAVSDETALIVDSIETMAELLGRAMPRP